MNTLRLNKASQQKQTGFTLIEISIVLVIIALLLGGVMKGQTLVKNAKYNSWVSEIEAYRTAFFTFEATYGGLPGDYKYAEDRLDAPAGVTVTSGGGDGIIGGGGNTNVRYESGRAIQHLILAGLLKGDPSRLNVETATPVGGTYNSIATGAWANGKTAHKLLMYGVSGEMAKRLDADLDDGNPLTGSIARHQGRGETWDTNAFVNVFVEL